jgi:hypothetical protein
VCMNFCCCSSELYWFMWQNNWTASSVHIKSTVVTHWVTTTKREGTETEKKGQPVPNDIAVRWERETDTVRKYRTQFLAQIILCAQDYTDRLSMHSKVFTIHYRIHIDNMFQTHLQSQLQVLNIRFHYTVAVCMITVSPHTCCVYSCSLLM